LIIPYTLSENDMRFASPNGFSNAEQFTTYLKDSLDYLVEEGRRGSPKMMTVGLHCRLVGRPGRAKGLEEFLEYAKSLGAMFGFANAIKSHPTGINTTTQMI